MYEVRKIYSPPCRHFWIIYTVNERNLPYYTLHPPSAPHSTCELHLSIYSKGESHVEIKGYAWSGQGNRIARVDLTTDGGKTW